MENMSLVIGVNQLGITVCSLVLGAVAEPRGRAPARAGAARRCTSRSRCCTRSRSRSALAVVVYLHVVLGEMIPKNIALAGPDRAALVLGTPIWAIVSVIRPVIVGINALASASLRLVGRRACMDEVSSTYTREEVAALVEESRGEGLLEDGEYDRLSGALGFTEKTSTTVLMPPDDAPDRTPRLDRRGRRGAVRRDRLQPVPGGRRRRRAGRLPAHQGRARDRRGPARPAGRGQVDPAVRTGRAPTTCCTTPCEKLQRRGRPHGPRRRRARAPRSGVATLEDVIEELVGEIRDAAHAGRALTCGGTEVGTRRTRQLRPVAAVAEDRGCRRDQGSHRAHHDRRGHGPEPDHVPGQQDQDHTDAHQPEVDALAAALVGLAPGRPIRSEVGRELVPVLRHDGRPAP